MDVPADARCLACGYALRDLPDPRCPECGRGFDPAEHETMRLPLPPRYTPRQACGLVAWAVTAVAIALLLRATFVANSEAVRTPLAVVTSLYVASYVRRRVDPPPANRVERWERRGMWAALFAFALVVGCTTFTCVHGTLWGTCGFGLARSELGGPCHSGARGSRCRHLTGDWYVWWQ